MLSIVRGLLACGLLALLLPGQAWGDPLRSWEELRAQPKRRTGLFGQWAPDQRKVERTLRVLERRRQGELSTEIEAQLAGKTPTASELELLARHG